MICLLVSLLFYSYVASYPYSRSCTSRRYNFRVCDVRLSVEAPYYRLLEVQKNLGQLKDFTIMNETCDSDTEDSHKFSDCQCTSEHGSPCPLTLSDDDSTPTVPAPFTLIQLQIKERPQPDDDTTPIVPAPFTPLKLQIIEQSAAPHKKQPKRLFM